LGSLAEGHGERDDKGGLGCMRVVLDFQPFHGDWVKGTLWVAVGGGSCDTFPRKARKLNVVVMMSGY
jgi:hypothetical protein